MSNLKQILIDYYKTLGRQNQMEQITVTLPKNLAEQLRDASEKIGVKPEALLLLSLQEKLVNLDKEFTDTMKHVLQKNAELYERLA